MIVKVISDYKVFVSLKVPNKPSLISFKPGENLVEFTDLKDVEVMKKYYPKLHFEEIKKETPEQPKKNKKEVD